MNTLEEVEECFVAREDVFYCLSRVLHAHTSSEMIVDIPREAQRSQ